MSITTYAELQTSIGNFLNRSDMTAVIPDFIAIAEAQVQRRVRHWQMEKSDTIAASSRYSALPGDFLEPIRLTVDGKHKSLMPMSLNEMSDERYQSDDTAGDPEFYAITAGQLELFPTPGAAVTVNIDYYRTIEPLSGSATSNWLLAEAPDVYLYGALMQSAPYLVDDKRIAVWGALFQSAIEEMQASSDRAKWGGPLRIRA